MLYKMVAQIRTNLLFRNKLNQFVKWMFNPIAPKELDFSGDILTEKSEDRRQDTKPSHRFSFWSASKINYSNRTISSLASAEIQKMYTLFEKYYTDISYDLFVTDLNEKTHILVIQKGPDIVGFTTILRFKSKDSDGATFLFSGDTVVREDFWGTKYLQKAFVAFIFKSKLRSPFKPLYWMLMSKGYKTYLLMSVNFAQCWPKNKVVTPPSMQKVMDDFYSQRYGAAYHKSKGLILFDHSRGAVKGQVAEPPEKLLAHPDVQFFLAKNPRYREGVELACMAKIQFSDFFSFIGKYFSR